MQLDSTSYYDPAEADRPYGRSSASRTLICQDSHGVWAGQVTRQNDCAAQKCSLRVSGVSGVGLCCLPSENTLTDTTRNRL